MTKNEQIKQTLKETREKRKSQICRVYEVKIDESRLSNKQREEIKMLFIEGKRFYNHILNWSNSEENDIFKFSRKNCLVVEGLDKNKNKVEYKLRYLTSSLKDSIHKNICTSIKSISSLKKKGYQKNGGKLKFKSELFSLTFKQYGITHKIKSNNKIKIQGVSGDFRVRGLQQFVNIKNIDIADMKLLNKPNGYYLKFTVFINKSEIKEMQPDKEPIGIDFGCKNSFNFSDGSKINIKIEETERLKRLQRKMQHKVNGSNNFNRIKKLLNIEYQKLVNRKNDIANKLVSQLKQHKFIVIQDEQLVNWSKNNHGKAIQHSILGRIKAKLKLLPNTIVLDKFIPTTKFCHKCGKILAVKCYDKTITCCGITEDRDLFAAKNILWIGTNLFNFKIRLGQTKFKRAEFLKALENYNFSNKAENVETRSYSVFS